jgi:hypothetical protein
MTPLFIALTLSALPCGVTDEDRPCESNGGAPRGVACWRSSGGGSRISGSETKWIDLRTCTAGSLALTTVKGWPTASFSIPELPPSLKRSAKLQAAITAALVPPPEDPKNPRHALAVMKRPQLSDAVTTLPPEPWWPGPVPKQTNSSTPLDAPYDGVGECPCSLRFDGERFSRVREWKVGTQTLSMWAYIHVNRGDLAFAVTDEGDKRHRWLFSTRNPGREPEPHLEGTRWYLPVGDSIDESFSLLGYDASTGEAWGVRVREVYSTRVTDGGVLLEGRGKPVTRSWSSLGPAR